MPIAPPASYSMLGHLLVEDLRIPGRTFNLLFAALLLTALGAFIGGNLLLLDLEIFWRSALITLPCLGVVLLFFAVSRRLDSLAWGLALTYGALWVIGHARFQALVFVFYGLCAVALYDAARHLRLARRDWGLAALMAVLGTATVLGVQRAYTSFDMLYRLHAGSLHEDTLFHASIAAMIKNYGVASTGLLGLVETPYHVLSHTLMASISRLSGMSVIEVYGVAPWVLFAPLLLFCIVACCAMLDRTEQLSLPLVWGSTAVVLRIVPLLFGMWAVFGNYFGSESYLVALGLFMLGLGVLSKVRLTRSDLILVAFLSVLIANAKASVGLIYTGLWLTRLLWLHVPSRKMDLGAFALSLLAVAWTVLSSAKAASGDLELGFLPFVRDYSFGGRFITLSMEQFGNLNLSSLVVFLKGAVAFLSFFVFYFIFSWIFSFKIIYREGVSGLFRAPLGAYTIASAGFGILLIFFAFIPYGSVSYFTNVAMFVALPGVLGMSTLALQRSGLDQRLLIAAGLLIVCVVSLKTYYEYSLFSPSSIQARTAKNALIADLRELREKAPLDWVLRPKGESVLAGNPFSMCRAQPFLFPAVSERPWVGVIRSAPEDCWYGYYGYGNYGIIPGKRGVNVEPRLLPGMQMHDVGK